MVNTVTISVDEYDELRKLKETLDNKIKEVEKTRDKIIIERINNATYPFIMCISEAHERTVVHYFGEKEAISILKEELDNTRKTIEEANKEIADLELNLYIYNNASLWQRFCYFLTGCL